MAILGKPIHHNQDNRKAVRDRQALNEIHLDIGPNPTRNRERLQQAGRMDSFGLADLTNHTLLNIVLYFPTHTLPVKVSFSSVDSLVVARMTRSWVRVNIL